MYGLLEVGKLGWVARGDLCLGLALDRHLSLRDILRRGDLESQIERVGEGEPSQAMFGQSWSVQTAGQGPVFGGAPDNFCRETELPNGIALMR